MIKTYNVIGLMSGTSLDGLDMAFCQFHYDKAKWGFSLVNCDFVNYPESLLHTLKNIHHLSGLELKDADNRFTYFCAEKVKSFITNTKICPDFISSHGHTVFHQPEKAITLQIGNGELLAKLCGIDVISDFRTGDVALGGQGAPLVPVGDELLFGEYDSCINLGGFSNISYRNSNGDRIAYDICPVNIVLNKFANFYNQKYDDKGLIASEGKINHQLLTELNCLDYYKQSAPKSLGREWVETNIYTILDNYSNTNHKDVMASFTEHIAIQIAMAIEGKNKVLFTGGGTYNDFLIQRICQLSKSKIIIPNNTLIDFKEALVFAFLGVLRYTNQINCFASVTGAERDSCTGTIAKGIYTQPPWDFVI